MNKKIIATGSALASVALALGVGFGVANATEPAPPSGDNCTVNGNFNVVVAPNCQAGSTTAPTTNPPAQIPTLDPLPTFGPLPTLGPAVPPIRTFTRAATPVP